MIRIDDEYVINANDGCYILEKIGTIKDTNSKSYGEETRTIQGYYTTLNGALKGYKKIKIRKYIAKDTENSIKELIEEITNIDNSIREQFKGV